MAPNFFIFVISFDNNAIFHYSCYMGYNIPSVEYAGTEDDFLWTMDKIDNVWVVHDGLDSFSCFNIRILDKEG